MVSIRMEMVADDNVASLVNMGVYLPPLASDVAVLQFSTTSSFVVIPMDNMAVVISRSTDMGRQWSDFERMRI